MPTHPTGISKTTISTDYMLIWLFYRIYQTTVHLSVMQALSNQPFWRVICTKASQKRRELICCFPHLWRRQSWVNAFICIIMFKTTFPNTIFPYSLYNYCIYIWPYMDMLNTDLLRKHAVSHREGHITYIWNYGMQLFIHVQRTTQNNIYYYLSTRF